MKIHKTVLHDGDGRTMNVWAAAEDDREADAARWRDVARRRAANGEPVTALMFDNPAWLTENGFESWEFARQDGKTDDAEVKP